MGTVRNIPALDEAKQTAASGARIEVSSKDELAEDTVPGMAQKGSGLPLLHPKQREAIGPFWCRDAVHPADVGWFLVGRCGSDRETCEKKEEK